MKLKNLLAVLLAAVTLLAPLASASAYFDGPWVDQDPAPGDVLPEGPGPDDSWVTNLPSPVLPDGYIPVWFRVINDNFTARNALLDAANAARACFGYVGIAPLLGGDRVSGLPDWNYWGDLYPVDCQETCMEYLRDLVHYSVLEYAWSTVFERIDWLEISNFFTGYWVWDEWVGALDDSAWLFQLQLSEYYFSTISQIFNAIYTLVEESTTQMELLTARILDTLALCDCEVPGQPGPGPGQPGPTDPAPTPGPGDDCPEDCPCDRPVNECDCPQAPGATQPGAAAPGATQPGATTPNNNLPQTGAAVLNAGVAGVGVAGLGAVAAVIKKRK